MTAMRGGGGEGLPALVVALIGGCCLNDVGVGAESGALGGAGWEAGVVVRVWSPSAKPGSTT